MIKVFDSNLTFKGFLDRFNSFQCSQKYADFGSFSIKTILTPETVNLLKEGYFIQYKDFAGIIDSIQMYDNMGEASTISASGYDLLGLLKSRIIWKNMHFSGNSEEFLRKVVNENAINPTDTKRKIPFLTLGELSGLSQTTERNTQHESLYQECVKVCNVADYGFAIDLDAKAKQMKFRVYLGEDRTAGTQNPIIIGKDFDNVLMQDYTYSTKDEITTCLVEAETTSLTIGGEYSGFKRKETVRETTTKQEELTSAQYQNVLKAEGMEQLNGITECFDIDTNNTSLKLGDKITVRDKNWNLGFSARVEEKQTAIEGGFETITFLLGIDIYITVVIK